MDEGDLLMSARERERLRVIEAVEERRLSQSQAAIRLRLSGRQVKRLVRAFRVSGAPGLVSKRRGRPSNRLIAPAERERFVELVRRHYSDFGPTLAAEYLCERHGFRHSVPTLRGWMIDAGLWQSKRIRPKRAFQLRERRAALGELVQIDGSPHAWLENRGPRCALIAFVDDATGRMQYARFEPVESTGAYLRALHAYVTHYGRPVALYSDRHSIFRKHDPEDPQPTQFERAARALDIEPILALTPQAKGRVERTFQTLQDRLVKALRLARIRTLEQANAFLQDFIDKYNERFARPARCSNDAHRPLALNPEQLRWITSEQHLRTLSKSLSCQYRGLLYLIQTQGAAAYHLRGARITVCDPGATSPVVLLHQGKPLVYRLFERHDLPERVADDKTLDTMVEAAKRKQSRPRPAPTNHPWKRPFKPSAIPTQ